MQNAEIVRSLSLANRCIHIDFLFFINIFPVILKIMQNGVIKWKRYFDDNN